MNMQDCAAAVMSRDVIAVEPSATVREIAALLVLHNISAAPVLDHKGRLLGIVSEGDLMRPFTSSSAASRSWWLDMLAEGCALAPEFLEYCRQDKRTAEQIMTRDVVTADETTSLSEIADLLAKHWIKRVPIQRAEKVVGIVSRADLVRALASQPAAQLV